MNRLLVPAMALSLLIPMTASAQSDQWRVFTRGAAFATFASTAGTRPANESSGGKIFSTNWFEAGAERAIGSNTSVLFRGRVSLEPLTIPREGYVQLLQYVSPSSGGTGNVDRMRAADLVGELAARASWRSLQLYIAPVGLPALGPGPFAQRSSSIDFAESPFSYDVSESFYHATRVVNLGLTAGGTLLEAGVFHNAVTGGRHTSTGDGSIDSRAARITFGIASPLSAQLSYGELGRNRKDKVSSASVSYNGSVTSTTASFVRRKSVESLDAGAIESTLHLGRNTLMGRLEAVDRPAGFLGRILKERTTHFTVGYLFDVINAPEWRTGIGVNVDYHTQSRELQQRYAHKPQTVYLFLRARKF